MSQTKDNKLNCPLCGEPTWESHSDRAYSFSHGHKDYVVSGLAYAHCSSCDSRGYMEGQRDSNLKKIADFQSELIDYISPSTVLSVREKYDLTQEQANEIFGGGKQGFSKWERGIVVPSGTAARMMKLALKSPSAFLEMAEVAKVIVSKPPELEEQVTVVDLYAHLSGKAELETRKLLEFFSHVDNNVVHYRSPVKVSEKLPSSHGTFRQARVRIYDYGARLYTQDVVVNEEEAPYFPSANDDLFPNELVNESASCQTTAPPQTSCYLN